MEIFRPIGNSQLALTKSKGHGIWKDILILLIFYSIEQMIASMVMTPFLVSAMIKNIDLLSSPDFFTNYQIIMGFMSSPSITIVTLFSTAVMIIAVLVYTLKIAKWPIRALGIKKERFVQNYLVGILFGFTIFSIAVLICVVTGAVDITLSNDNMKYLLPVFFLAWMVQGFSEEILCRGWLMVSVGRKYSTLTAIIVNSLVFAALHLLNPGISVLAIINLFLFGVFASLLFLVTENIWMVAALHSVWNFVQGNFYGILVSGTTVTTSVFETNIDPSKALINGGDFGLEGGLGVTVAYVLGCVLLYVIYRKKKFSSASGIEADISAETEIAE